ncbi:hypothetical protein AC249_AIPGENE20740 [Exaiptasia diaphana]|nr:hypothetical protein AC249_AIPGENE20740 [Exaiptasia diaphana]
MTLSWCYHPFKRLFCPDDAFFEEGNIQCNLQRKQINCNEIEDLDEWSSKEFKCSVAGCNQYFVNIKKQNGENKEQSTGDSNETLMETEPYDSQSNSGHKHHSNPKPRPPRTICFGRGSSRGFHRPSRGNSRGKKRHNKSSIQEVKFPLNILII